MTQASPDASVQGINEAFVLGKCDYFVDVQLWPLRTELDPRGWLRNFAPDELEHAVSLLNAFNYFSRRLVDEMFVAAFQQLSVHLISPGEGYLRVQSAWQNFL